MAAIALEAFLLLGCVQVLLVISQLGAQLETAVAFVALIQKRLVARMSPDDVLAQIDDTGESATADRAAKIKQKGRITVTVKN